ncbi:multidrug ABC transporter ATP-binding protein [Halobacteriales archaeon SW_7_68_16]|nr:MAG: multidrug ABC transporter ATP-binding protein [Halobacteriales archaeon SW_7_68_16]
MSDDAVRVAGLAKRFGDVRALRGVEFTVERGEIFGLVGPNGAGKTTTLRTIATLLSVESGSVTVAGADVEAESNAVRSAIRYLPEDAGTYDNLSGRRYLRFVAGFFADDPAPLVERGVEIAGLGDRIDDRAGGYSKGMTRKLLLASALMTEPDLAILDEPTSGLDVRNARDIRDRIASFPSERRAVMLSSHDMLEVTTLCDRVGLLADGEIIDVDSPTALTERYGAADLEEAFLEATA